MAQHSLADFFESHIRSKTWENAASMSHVLMVTKWPQFRDMESSLNDLTKLPDDFRKLIRKLVSVFKLHERGKYEEAFTEHVEAIRILTGEFANNNKTNWCLPIVYALANNQKHLAMQIGVNDSDPKRIEAYTNCSQAIRSILTMCSGDAKTEKPKSKRVGLINILNHCMHLGFLTSNFTGLAPVINLIENDEELQKFATNKDFVTYNFYLGKHSLFEDDLARADKCLSYALFHNPREYKNNRKLILIYLITVKLLLGKSPPLNLLNEEGLEAFIPVIKAVHDGDVQRLDQTLDRYENYFIKLGILLILDKLKQITLLILFKKLYYDVYNSYHQIPIKAFYKALIAQGYNEYDERSVEALLAVMVSDKKIRGYISHGHATIVLSKKDPFGN
uniref:CSN12-like protein n=1 Tax=Rhabditophanes sp. KR3021 TaxID=114890 RepID=A0AC35UI76_9BILA